jgi:hypothetical protein
MDGYSYEVGVVGEDYGILLNGDFQLFLVRYTELVYVFGGKRVYASSFQPFNDYDVYAFVSVDFDVFLGDGLSSAFLGFSEFSDELFIFFDFLV